MKNKPTIVLMIILLVLSTVLGAYGLILSKSKSTPEEVKPKVAYEYYLEDEKIDIMPTKTDENGYNYEFSKYVCDNNMTLNFDNEEWNYTTSTEENGTCRLYFVRSDYVVELVATNGLVNGEEASFTSNVQRGTDGQFNIVPNEGYEFDGEVTCSNDKEAIYDISTNMLNINSISENVACKINFNKRNLKLDVIVKNGSGSTTENKEYGESISAVVQPNDGYEKPKITCTNKQEYTYDNNQLTIPKLTDNTVCTVTFSKTPAVTYSLIIGDLPDQVTITSGNKKQNVVSGKDGKFSLRASDGYSIILDCNGVKPSTEKQDPDGTITYTFLGVSRNITCNVNTSISDSGSTTNEGN